MTAKCFRSVCHSGAEHGLAFVEREYFLDDDEEQRRAEQIEDEPVQADIRRVVSKFADGNARTAERDGDDHKQERHDIQVAPIADDQVRERQATRDQQTAEQNPSQHIDGIFVAQFRRGQVFGKMEREDREQAQEAEREREDRRDHALSELKRAAAMQ